MNKIKLVITLIVVLLTLTPDSIKGQGFDPSLNLQGLDKTGTHSVVSSSLGSTVFGISNDADVLFANPAGLIGIKKPQLSVTNTNYNYSAKQVQQYAPAKYQPLWSLYMEGLIGVIPPHDTSIVDTGSAVIPRQFDKITPGWKTTKSKSLPINFSLAYPFSIMGIDFVVAAGGGAYANLNFTYQNNNVLSPAINNQRPVPISYLTGTALLPVEWYQKITARSGDLKRYGGAISASINEYFSAGFSLGYISGKSDDYERKTARGHMIYYSNYFIVDSIDDNSITVGNSDYKGRELIFSGTYTGQYFNAGIIVKPPFDITRKINSSITRDSSGKITESITKGEEKISYPLRGSAGIALKLRKNLKALVEYDYNPYSKLEYKKTDGSKEKPWRDISGFKAGLEFSPLEWLSLRFGARELYEVFEPIGNPLEGEPVSGSAYSAGIGINYYGIALNAAYEYSRLTYEDMLENTVFLNEIKVQNFSIELKYDLPFFYR